MRRHLLFILLGLLSFSAFVQSDTYDERTLVRISLPLISDREFVQASKIDVVDAGSGWAKALLRPQEFRLLKERGLKVEILKEEMKRDRELWKAADAAAAAKLSPAYYTPSKFNLVDPPAGSLMAHLLALHNAYPDITRLYDIGDSASGLYDIIALELSANPDVEENEPKIRIYGNIHGDEKSALMVPCDVLDWILANYPTNQSAVTLVDNAEIWFIPMGNPDGNANNSRYNIHGIDLNRNFWGPAGNSEGDPFSEPETQAIRDLTEVMGKRFNASISFHAGATCFNAVYNYISTPTSDEPIFFSSRSGGPQGEATPSQSGLAQAYQLGCTTPGFWFTNGADWYITYGDTNDWSYGMWSDLDTTLELTLIKTPPVSSIPIFCAQHRQATINYMLAALQGISGRMTDGSTGAPLEGTVTVTATASQYINVPHTYQQIFTDPDVGDFHRVLQPATYTVQCSAPGYPDLVSEDIVVTAGNTSVVDCPMGTCAIPSVIHQPASQTIVSGMTATMNVAATGNGPLTYQWYIGNSGDTSSPIAGATSDAYTTPPLTASTSYWVRISNGCGATDSSTAVITVCTPVSISANPASQTINAGQTATLNVTTTGDLPQNYQWYEGQTGDTSNPIAGATSNSYTTPPLTASTSYWVRISNGCGSTDSNTAVITVCTPVSISTNPASQTINAGQTATLNVTTGGDLPQNYQWYEGQTGDTSNPIAGATADIYTTPALSSDTSYWVRVSNSCGSADSSSATITVVTVCLYFCDDFEDTDDSNWTFKGGAWNPASPDLSANTTRSATAFSPAFSAPPNRTVAANVSIDTNGANVSVYGWYAGKSENVELRLMQGKGKLLLIQRTGGKSKKTKLLMPFNTAQVYLVTLIYDGSAIQVFIDGASSPVMTMTPIAAPQGHAAFKVKRTTVSPVTARMSDISVN